VNKKPFATILDKGKPNNYEIIKNKLKVTSGSLPALLEL